LKTLYESDKEKNDQKKKQLGYAVFSQLEWTLLQVCVSYPCISRSAREKKDDQGKNTAKGESWRDKPTDGKLQQRLSSSLIKQNNCWVQLASTTSNSRCSAELQQLYGIIFRRQASRYN